MGCVKEAYEGDLLWLWEEGGLMRDLALGPVGSWALRYWV